MYGIYIYVHLNQGGKKLRSCSRFKVASSCQPAPEARIRRMDRTARDADASTGRRYITGGEVGSCRFLGLKEWN